MAETPPIFITNETMTAAGGNITCDPDFVPTRLEIIIKIPYAKNQGTARAVPANISAPIGASSDQRITAPEAAKPPKCHCSKNGRIKISANCPRQNNLYFFEWKK